MTNLLIEDPETATAPPSTGPLTDAQKKARDENARGLRASFTTASTPQLSPMGEVWKNTKGWLEVFVTWINSIVGVRKMDGSKYERSDFDAAMRRYNGTTGEREEDASKKLPFEPGAAKPHLVKPGTTAKPGATTPDATSTKPSAPTVSDMINVKGAVAGNNTVTFNIHDGTTNCDISVQKTGGSAGWRNNNPGLLGHDDLAAMALESKMDVEQFKKQFGVAGEDANGVLVFKNMTYGVVADMIHMQKNYKDLTLADAIGEMTAGSDNDQQMILLAAAMAKVDPNKKVSELKPGEFGEFVRVAAHVRGLQTGEITITGTLTPESNDQLRLDQGGKMVAFENLPKGVEPGTEPKPATAPAATVAAPAATPKQP